MLTAVQKEIIAFVGVNLDKAPPTLRAEIEAVLQHVQPLKKSSKEFAELDQGMFSIGETVCRRHKDVANPYGDENVLKEMSEEMTRWFLYWVAKHYGMAMPAYVASLKTVFGVALTSRTGP